MQLVFTGPHREAVALHRILKTDGIDAVCMTGTDHPTGAVFVPVADAENRATIDRAIERMKSEREAEGDDVVEKEARRRDTPALYHDVWLAIREACLRLNELDSHAISTNQSEQVALACRHHLYRIRQFFSRLNGGENRTLEEVLSRAVAILMGIHALAVEHANDPDPFEAMSAIGYLGRMLDEQTGEGAAERWAALDHAYNELAGTVRDASPWKAWSFEPSPRRESLRRGQRGESADDA